MTNEEIDARIAEMRAAWAAVVPGQVATYQAAKSVIDTAMTAFGLPPFVYVRGGPMIAQRPILAAAALDETQRAAATRLAHVNDVLLADHPIPSTDRARRRWLGIDPPGPLFQADADGSTLFERVRAPGVSRDAILAMIAAVPMPAQLELAVELDLLPMDFSVPTFGYEVWKIALGIDARSEVLARDVAAHLLALRTRPRSMLVQMEPNELRLVALLGLARAGVAIDPAYDALLPLQSTPAEALDAILGAIPESRRAAAILASVPNVMFPNEVVPKLVEILARHPYAAVAALALAKIDTAKDPKKALRELTAIGKAHPEIGALVKAHVAATPKIPKLAIGARLEGPTLAQLSDVEQRQLEQCEKRYGGRDVSAAEILARPTDEEIEEAISPAFLALVRLTKAKKPAFDAWLYMADSGCVFRAGTTELVAEIIQSGLECSDAALKAALIDVLLTKKKKR